MTMKNSYIKILAALALLLLLNVAGNYAYKRFDLTQDKRYTLSEEMIALVEDLKAPLQIKVYLQGDFPSEFKRLQAETRQFLEELSAINGQVQFRFIDPLSSSRDLMEKGLQPSRLTVQEGGKVSEAVIFPWALLSYEGKEAPVSLLVNAVAPSQEQQLQNSIENLEYEFADGLHKLLAEKSKKIAVLRGNGELEDIKLYSVLKRLGEYYRLAEFTLDSVDRDPLRTLERLMEYDMALVAKPTEAFSEKEKFALDQFLLRGGRTLWLVDNVQAEMDSLMASGKSVALNRDLNLTDLFFSYGVRINYNVAKDLYSGTIRLASGNTGNQVQYQDFLWQYFPLIFPDNGHPITRNLDPVLLRFPSSVDTLDNGLKKTVLLASSPLTRVIGTPVLLALDEIAEESDRSFYNDAGTAFGVLVEGSFRSAYADRIHPFDYDGYQERGTPSKMVLISYGDINGVIRGEALPVERDMWTSQPYGNSDFMLHAVHYLLDADGLIQLRSKSLQLQFLDKERAFADRTFWQVLNVLLPLLMLTGSGILFQFIRKRRYG